VTRIVDAFARARGRSAFVPYVCAGDPDKRFTIDLVKSLARAGADIIELGMPFSDPVADGPVIQQAMNRSLAAGFRCSDVFELIAGIRKDGIDQPIVVMTYYNPVLRMGVKEFCSRLAQAGADGILPVDLPPEESMELDSAASQHGLDVIRLIAPSTSDSRIEYILTKAQGFVYVVSVAGTTGARNELPRSAVELLGRVTSRSKLPVVLGFGISSPEHVRAAISSGASGVVEGSKLISIYSTSMNDRSRALEAVRAHASQMVGATSGTD
jgi:tryptophan synthase alpha chain